MKKNRTDKINKIGISLISLIITIIVIIILAAIVIFTGLNTPDRANFAKFVQGISDFRTAVTQEFMNKKANYSIANKSRSDAQIYYIIANGGDDSVISDINDTLPTGTLISDLGITGIEGTYAYEISRANEDKITGWKSREYYEPTEKHYITDAGDVFVIKGYRVEEDGSDKWYLNERTYTGMALNSGSGEAASVGSLSPTVLTIGSEYDKGNIKIGDKLSYLANGESNWIVFGKDESGNVLLTSETPVGSYSPTYNAQHWLTWEDDLNTICDDYGSTIQGKAIQSRSIRIEDINRVVGFTEPNFTKYKFTTDVDGNNQYVNGKVNYYYPSLDAVSNSPAYFQKATVTALTATSPDVPAKEFDCNAYYYKYNTSDSKYVFFPYIDSSYIPEEIDTTINLIKYANMNYVVGETGSYMQYFVASRSVGVSHSGADFNFSYVMDGCVYRGGAITVQSNSSGGNSGYGPSGWGLRPVVILPSDIEVEEVTAGKFDIKN